MSKVKLTQEQADAIEELVSVMGYKHEEIIRLHSVDPNDWLSNGKPLNGMPLLDLVDSLRIGYEVEPEFKVGEWATHKLTGDIGVIKLVNDESIHCDNGMGGWINDFRHATPEEIAVEKERRWWVRHGRNPWELKDRDLLINENEDIFKVTNSNPPEGYYSIEYTLFDHDEIKRGFRVLCFAENRLDVRNDE